MSTGFEKKKSKTKTSFAGSVDSFDITNKFPEYFTQITDPRAERTRYHLLTDIITIAIMFVIAGAQGWEDIQEYGLSKEEWLKTFLELPFGIPSPDTFRRVFERINPKEFEQCFRVWVQSLVENLGVEVVAIDGKTHRGSYDRESQLKSLHTVSAWSSEHRLVLGQTKVSDKSNEITAIPALLEILDISGCIITIELHQQDLWAGLTTVVMVVRSIQHWNKTTHEVQFYITSLTSDAHKIGSAIRQQCSIENSVHWTLDVTFHEDESRIRSLHSPQNFALLRRIALNVLERETSFRRSIRQKSRRAAMNDQYMVSVLTAALPNSTLS